MGVDFIRTIEAVPEDVCSRCYRKAEKIGEIFRRLDETG